MILYLSKTFWPASLSADYSFNQIKLISGFWNPYTIGGLAILTLTFFLIFSRRTRTTALGWGALIFLASYFIVSNFIFPIGTIMAERMFYLPSLGLVAIIAYFFDKLIKWKFKKVWIGLLSLILLAGGIRIIGQNRIWVDEKTLFENMIKKSPDSAHALANLGSFYIQNGRWQEGKSLFEKSNAIMPGVATTLDSLGIIAGHEESYDLAEKYFLASLAAKPDYPVAVSNLGHLYFKTKKFNQAADLYLREYNLYQTIPYLQAYVVSSIQAGKLKEPVNLILSKFGPNPEDANVRLLLGYAYFWQGKKDLAANYFAGLKPDNISDEQMAKALNSF